MENAKKNIVIAGAGFGGVTAALILDKAFYRNQELRDAYQLIIINNHHSHLYTAALYEIAAIPQGHHKLDYIKSSITIPLAAIFHETHVDWREREITSIDRDKKLLTFDNTEELHYEYLILALGSETSYFNIPGAKEHSFALKTFADGIKLRDRVQQLIESGDAEPLRIVIAGAGASGVEVAAEFENFICMLQKHQGKEAICKTEVMLVEATPEILPGFAPWIIEKAKKRLSHIGVQIKTGVAITAVEKDSVSLKDGTKLPFTVLVWAGGVRAASVLKTTGLALSPKGAVPVSDELETAPKVFAIGDNAACMNPATQRPLPWNVPIAEHQARTVAENIIADLCGTSRQKFVPLKNYPFILAVGRKYAIADLVYIHEWGFTAWLLKLLVELKYLLSILPILEALSTWWKYVSVARSND